jgi:hypothetical protein
MHYQRRNYDQSQKKVLRYQELTHQHVAHQAKVKQNIVKYSHAIVAVKRSHQIERRHRRKIKSAPA